MIRPKSKKLQNQSLAPPSDKKYLQSSTKHKLFPTTQKMQHKLSLLKQQILQKKKKAQLNNNISQQQKKMSTFLRNIKMGQYQQLLIQNGIDSFDILKDAKQVELQQIGILKGHALKIMINIKKYQKQDKQIVKQQQYKKQYMATNQTLSKEVYNIQTQELCKLFCLYCFKRSQNSYCSKQCQIMYNDMFYKYQNNLEKAVQMFGGSKEEGRQEEDKREVLNCYDFLNQLGQGEEDDFDGEEYQRIKEMIKKQ